MTSNIDEQKNRRVSQMRAALLSELKGIEASMISVNSTLATFSHPMPDSR